MQGLFTNHVLMLLVQRSILYYWSSLLLANTYKDGDVLRNHYIVNMCCNRQHNSENWAFFRTVWTYHLTRARQNQGFYSRFTGIELTGDNAGHFKNDRVMHFQSQWFQLLLFEKTVESYFLCDRHAYSEADGIWGVLSMLFRRGEAKGVRLSTVWDYAKYFSS